MFVFFLSSDTNQRLGVLLSDGCRPPPQQSSAHLSAPTTRDSLHTGSPLETSRGPDRTSHSSSGMLTESTQARRSTAGATPPPPPPVSSSSLLPSTTTLNAPPEAPAFTPDTQTTAGAFKSPHSSTHLDNRTTPASFPDSTAGLSVATDDIISPSNIHSIATTSSQREQHSDAITMSSTTGTTAGHNQTSKDDLTTVTLPSNKAAATTETYKTENSLFLRSHHDHTNTRPDAADYSLTTVTHPSNNTTTDPPSTVITADVWTPHTDTNTRSTNTPSNHTTLYNNLTQDNTTNSSTKDNNTFTPNSNPTDANSFTHNHTHAAVNSVATVAHAETTVSKNNNSSPAVTVAANATTGLLLLPDSAKMTNNATVSASGLNTTTVSLGGTVRASFTRAAFRETQQVALPTSASEGYTVSNAAAISQTSARSSVSLNSLTTPLPHSITASSRGYSTANAGEGPSGSGISTANVSQTSAGDPAVAASATSGNAGLSASDASMRRGQQSAEMTVPAVTPPLASATATTADPTKPGLFSSKLLHLKIFRNGEKLIKPSTSRQGATQTSAGATTKTTRVQEEQARQLLDQTQDVSQLNSSQVKLIMLTRAKARRSISL